MSRSRSRTAAAAALVVVGTALLGTPHLAATAAPVPRPVRVLLVGDSLTHGSTGDWTWRYRLWKHLQSSGTRVDLVGPNHALHDLLTGTQDDEQYADPAFDRDHAARWGMAMVAMDHPIAELVADYDPDVVVELLGTNDLVYWQLTPARVHQEVRRLVADARSADPDVDVVLGALPQVWNETFRAYDDGLPALAADLDQAGSRVVATDVPDLDIDVDTWDTSHPSATGEVKIAAAVADALAGLGIGTAYPRPLPVVANGPVGVAALTGTEGTEATAGTAGTAGTDTASLTWTNPPGQTGERLWSRDVTSGQAWTRDPTPSGQTDTTRTVDDLLVGHRYEFRLQAFKGSAVAEDRYSNVVSVPPVPPVPPVVPPVVPDPAPGPGPVTSTPAPVASGPAGLRARLLAGHRARLAWPGSTGATSYAVQERRAAGWRTVAVTDRRRFTTTRLADGRVHRFRVVARTGEAAGGTSPTVRVRTAG